MYGFIQNNGISAIDPLGLRIFRQKRGNIKTSIYSPNWVPAYLKGEMGIRYTSEECDDNSSKVSGEFYGSLTGKALIRAGAVSLEYGDVGLFGTMTFQGDGKFAVNFCGNRLNGVDLGLQISIWGGVELDLMLAKGSIELSGGIRIYMGSSDKEGTVYVRADAAFKARGKYFSEYGMFKYEDMVQLSARNPPFNFLEITKSSVTIAGFEIN